MTTPLQLPAQFRAVLPGKPDFETEDRLDQVVDAFLRELASTPLIVPEAERTSTYSTKPGPRPKRNGPRGNIATQERTAKTRAKVVGRPGLK